MGAVCGILRAASTLALASVLAVLGAPALVFAQGAPPKAPAAAPKGKPAPKVAARPQPKAPVAVPKGKKGASVGKRAPRKPGTEPGQPDEATRRIIAGTAGRLVRESPELRAMRELDLALFPSSAPSGGSPWIAEGTPLVDRGEPRLFASGMPPEARLPPEPGAESSADLAWLQKLAMPDLPVRWDARVVRYLDYYKNNPRGRGMVQGWLRRSGRYGGAIRRVLREQGLPEDILWLALVESGFDPTIQSPAGAAGLWQFMPEGARIYGLTVDRWVDERLDPERSTLAAARYLADLRQRFGTWELAFAAYNMGYGGLLASIRKYNTNDFWELSRLESGMPLETSLYVPKIVAMAIVSRNKAVFGGDDLELDPAVSFDKLAVGPGVSLRALAVASGTSEDKLGELNPQLLAGRAPPALPGGKDDATWTVRVPPGAAPRASKTLGQALDGESKLERYALRWGESLDDVATRRRVSRGALASLNGVRRDEVLRPGTVIFVPLTSAPRGPDEGALPRPVVVVPAQAFAYPDRERVFYRVIAGDTLRDLASVFGVAEGEICRWNALDATASLHDGMTLQVFAPKGRGAREALVLEEKDARVLVAGTPEFYAHFEAQRGRTRLEMVAKDGDNWRALARRYGLTMGQIERINQKARTSPLAAGDRFVVYVPLTSAPRAPAIAPKDKPEDKPDEAVAVTKPPEDDAAKDKDDDAVKPAVLRKDGDPDAKEPPAVDKGEAPAAP